MGEAAVSAADRRTLAPGGVSSRVAAWHALSFLAACGLTLTALALRLHAIDHEPLWLDEGYTLLFSSLPLGRLFLVGGAHEHPPLYYLLVHLLFNVRNSYLVPRMLSAASGSLSVLALYALGTRLYGRMAGLTAAALLTVSPFHLWYSQDARAYELAGLFVLLSYLTGLTALDAPRRSIWLAYVLCTALALYTEYTTLFVLLPQTVYFLRARERGLARSLIKAWVGAALLFAPWLGTVTLDAASIAGNYWIPSPGLDDVTTTALEFLGLRTPCPSPPCTGGGVLLPFVGAHESLIALGAITGALTLMLVALLARIFALRLLMLWLVLPFVLVLLLSLARSLYLDRVFLDATFPLYLLTGAAVSGIRRSLARFLVPTALALLMAMASVVNLHPVYSETTNPDWISAAHDLQAAYRTGQAVVYYPGTLQKLVKAYLPPSWHASREYPLWFHTYLDVPGWEQRYAALTRSALAAPGLTLAQKYGRLDAELRERELAEATAGARQVWLVTQDYSGINDTRRWFAVHGFHLLLSEIYSGDARLELWDRGLPAGFGAPVVPDNDFRQPWSSVGHVSANSGAALEMGTSTLQQSFSVRQGVAYVANIEYRAILPAALSAQILVYDRFGRPLGQMHDRFGNHLIGFPRTEWYNMPVTGAWTSEPFGFVAPPGATRAVIVLHNGYGWSYWRHIAVYRER